MTKLKFKFDNGIFKALIDETSALEDIAEVVNEVKKYKNVKEIDVDMHSLSYIQSKVLAEIMALKKYALKMKYEFFLLNANSHIVETLEMTNLTGFLSIKDDFSIYSLDELCDKFLGPDGELVLEYLAANYDEAVRKKLVMLSDSNDSIIKESAILTMGRAQDFESIEIFRSALSSDYGNVRGAAVSVLGWIGDVASKAHIYQCLEDPYPGIAEAAAASIALLSDNTDADKLNKYLNNPDQKKRIHAAEAMALIGDDKCYKYIKEHFDVEQSEEVRVWLVKLISLFNKKEVADILFHSLDDSSISVKKAAASGLVRIGPGKHAEDLLKKVTDKDIWVGFFAAKALAGSNDDTIISGLLALYPNVDQNIKLAIIEVMSQKSSEHMDFFERLLKDDNEDIRKEALNALSLSDIKVALKLALSLYNSDSSWLVRYKAIDIIIDQEPAGYEALLREALKSESSKYVRDKILSGIGE